MVAGVFVTGYSHELNIYFVNVDAGPLFDKLFFRNSGEFP